jgi:hypothetical protein
MKLHKLIPSGKLFGIEIDLLVVWWPVAVVGLGIFLSLGSVILPFFTNMSNRQSQYLRKKQQNLEVLKKITYLSSQDAEELSSNSEKIASAFLPSKDSYALVGVLSQIGKKFGYDVDSFSLSLGEILASDPKAAPKKNQIEKVDAALSLVGPKDNYYSLVAAVERTLPLMKITSLDMKVVSGLAKVELGVASYYVPGEIEASTKDYSLNDKELTMLKQIREFESIENGLMMGGSVENEKNIRKRADPFVF